MKHFLVLWMVVMALLSTGLGTMQAADGQLFACRDNTVEWVRFTFRYEGDAPDYWGFVADGASGDLNGLTADAQADGTASFFVFIDGAYHTIAADAATAPCEADDPGTGEPDGGLSTITFDVAPGCYEWSIADDYGHWSAVATTCSQQEGADVFVRLVLGRDNPITDPERYRAWKVEDDQ